MGNKERGVCHKKNYKNIYHNSKTAKKLSKLLIMTGGDDNVHSFVEGVEHSHSSDNAAQEAHLKRKVNKVSRANG